MRWTTNKGQHEYMRRREQQNLGLSLRNQNENQAAAIIATESRLRWQRQKPWGCRLFDFWCGHKGVAIEIDGPEHNDGYDSARDRYNSLRSCIVVFRVPNGDLSALRSALQQVHAMPSWKERRQAAGTSVSGPGSMKIRRQHVYSAGLKLAHGDWTPDVEDARQCHLPW
jgi:very-short-patch-repair endonuclease